MSATMTEPDERSLRIRLALSMLGSIAVYAVVARFVAPIALEGSGVTLRSRLRAIIGSEPARILSLMPMVGSGVGILALDLRAEEAHGATTGPAHATALQEGAVGAYLVISAFLVLMPYLGRYDDLFLVACVALVSLFGQRLKSYGMAVGALAAMVVATQLTAPGDDEPAHLILGAKVLALGGLSLLLGRGGDPLTVGQESGSGTI